MRRAKLWWRWKAETQTQKANPWEPIATRCDGRWVPRQLPGSVKRRLVVPPEDEAESTNRTWSVPPHEPPKESRAAAGAMIREQDT
jgi:hypothetical protein